MLRILFANFETNSSISTFFFAHHFHNFRQRCKKPNIFPTTFFRWRIGHRMLLSSWKSRGGSIYFCCSLRAYGKLKFFHSSNGQDWMTTQHIKQKKINLYFICFLPSSLFKSSHKTQMLREEPLITIKKNEYCTHTHTPHRRNHANTSIYCVSIAHRRIL